jgi:uncharacterized coiled-coil protein SlyX
MQFLKDLGVLSRDVAEAPMHGTKPPHWPNRQEHLDLKKMAQRLLQFWAMSCPSCIRSSPPPPLSIVVFWGKDVAIGLD